MLQGGSLSLSPFIARWFYGDMQDIHQCVYGRKPVQAPSPLLPTDLAGEIPLDTGVPSHLLLDRRVEIDQISEDPLTDMWNKSTRAEMWALQFVTE